MTLLLLMAHTGQLYRNGKADASDLTLVMTYYANLFDFWQDDVRRASGYHAHALRLVVQGSETPHFHVIYSIQASLKKENNPQPLKKRIESGIAWLPYSRTAAGRAYLLSSVAKALAAELPEQALRLADEYCELAEGEADEYPCRLRDRGNLLYLCGRYAESVSFIEKLVPQDAFRAGLKQLEMARGLVALQAFHDAGACLARGKQILSPYSFPYVDEMVHQIEVGLS